MELGVKFYRCDNFTIMSGLVVRYKVNTDDNYGGEISASREGVLIARMDHLTNIQEVLDVQRVLARAYLQFTELYKGNMPYGFDSDPLCVVEMRKYRVMSREYEVIDSREYA